MKPEAVQSRPAAVAREAAEPAPPAAWPSADTQQQMDSALREALPRQRVPEGEARRPGRKTLAKPRPPVAQASPGATPAAGRGAAVVVHDDGDDGVQECGDEPPAVADAAGPEPGTAEATADPASDDVAPAGDARSRPAHARVTRDTPHQGGSSSRRRPEDEEDDDEGDDDEAPAPSIARIGAAAVSAVARTTPTPAPPPATAPVGAATRAGGPAARGDAAAAARAGAAPVRTGAAPPPASAKPSFSSRPAPARVAAVSGLATGRDAVPPRPPPRRPARTLDLPLVLMWMLSAIAPVVLFALWSMVFAAADPAQPDVDGTRARSGDDVRERDDAGAR